MSSIELIDILTTRIWSTEVVDERDEMVPDRFCRCTCGATPEVD